MNVLRLLSACLFACLPIVAQDALKISGVPEGAPFEVAAQASGDLLVVDLTLDPEWHVYAEDVGGGAPVELRVADGADFAAAGSLRMPPANAGKLSGDVRLELPIERTGAGHALRAELDLMACDPLQCLPPMTVLIEGEVAPAAEPAESVSVLLVVDVVDERSGRIEAFLRERGFDVEVTTYPEATAAACEAHDVVLADSKLFRQTAAVREAVLAFPRTKTPIVAVGFFGTQLIEAHGIAMTSGYI